MNETGRPVAKALAALTATQAWVVMGALAVPVMAPLIAPDLGLDPTKAGFFSALVFAAAFLASAWSGRLIRRAGSVGASQITVLVAACGMLMVASGSLPLLALAALAMGAAYAPGNPASSALLMRLVPPARRSLIFSLKQTAVPIGGAMAGSGLTAIAALWDWRIALLIAAAGALVLVLAVEPWRRGLDRTDQTAPQTGQDRGRTGLARLLAEAPGLRLVAAMAFSFAAVQFAFSAIFTAYLTQGFGLSAAQAGQALSIAFAASIALRIGAGFVADRMGGMRVLAAMAAVMLGAALICALAPPTARTLVIPAGIVLGALAFGWNGVFLAEAARIAPAGRVADATSASMAAVFLGGSIGPAAFSGLVALSGGFAVPFGLLALFATAALVLALRGARTRGT